MKITFGNDQTSVTMTTDQDRYVRELLKRTTGTALESMERTVDEIYDNARAKWPRGKKRQRRSADQLVKGTRLVSDSKGYYIGGYIGNDAPWAFYIVSKHVPKFGSAAAPVTLSPPLDLDFLEEEAVFGKWVEGEDGEMRVKGNHAYTELIRKPFNAHLSELAEELQRETARLARTL